MGALDMRFEDRGEGLRVIIVFSRGGIAEIYESQLAWVSESEAELVRAGKLRLGESFDYVDRGWWHVIW